MMPQHHVALPRDFENRRPVLDHARRIGARQGEPERVLRSWAPLADCDEAGPSGDLLLYQRAVVPALGDRENSPC
jgi:hypothetical protein